MSFSIESERQKMNITLLTKKYKLMKDTAEVLNNIIDSFSTHKDLLTVLIEDVQTEGAVDTLILNKLDTSVELLFSTLTTVLSATKQQSSGLGAPIIKSENTVPNSRFNEKLVTPTNIDSCTFFIGTSTITLPNIVIPYIISDPTARIVLITSGSNTGDLDINAEGTVSYPIGDSNSIGEQASIVHEDNAIITMTVQEFIDAVNIEIAKMTAIITRFTGILNRADNSILKIKDKVTLYNLFDPVLLDQ
jgi:hypothetical protein